tara:strand:+ start:82 stop:381 length:300 start_codon:yes stop_codon:yes gene_type:complete
MRQWQDLAQFTRERGEEIFGNKFPENFQSLIHGMESIAEYWGTVFSDENEVTPAKYARQHKISVARARKYLNAAVNDGHCEKIRRGREYVYMCKKPKFE